MSKTILILLGLAVVQSALLLFAGANSDDDTATNSLTTLVPLMSPLPLKELQRLEITDEDGNFLVFEQGPEKDGQPTFVVANKDGYPARTDSVESALKPLGELRLGREVTKKPQVFTELEVADERFARKVKAIHKDGRTLADFYLGEGKQSGTCFLRKAGDSVAYLAHSVATYDFSATVANAIESLYFETTSDDVVAVKLDQGGTGYELQRRERPKAVATPPAPPEPPKEGEKPPEPPKPEMEVYWVVKSPESEAEADKTKVDNFVRSLSRIYIGTLVGKGEKPEHGFATPKAVATLTMKDGATKVVTIGAKNDKGDEYYAKASTTEFVCTLRSYTIDEQFLKKSADLLPTPPGTTPEEDHSGHDHK